MSASILVVEDDAALREALCDTLDLAGFHTRSASDGNGALLEVCKAPTDLVVSDVRMAGLDGIGLLAALRAHHPRLPVLLMTAYGTVQQAVEAMRRGAADYLIKPFEAEVLVGKVASYFGTRGPSDEFIAVDPRALELVALARRVASSEVSVMLSGESGSGKEVLAHYIHHCSARAEGPFVAINCAAIPDNMLEAMLFGYEKGAFTGAIKACPGKFEQAQGGMILLDEVTEMNLGLQAKLLRVLQEREVERLGGHDIIRLDLRVIATSNRDLRAAVDEGRFREDLYYRLNVFPLNVPALRERPADIVPIAEHLARRAARLAGHVTPHFSGAAQTRLCAHDWPGNVRELDNVVQRALVLEMGAEITVAALHIEGTPQPSAGVARGPGAVADESLHGELALSEQRLILDALAAGSGSRKLAAERLGISPRTLRYKIARIRESGVAIPG